MHSKVTSQSNLKIDYFLIRRFLLAATSDIFQTMLCSEMKDVGEKVYLKSKMFHQKLLKLC